MNLFPPFWWREPADDVEDQPNRKNAFCGSGKTAKPVVIADCGQLS